MKRLLKQYRNLLFKTFMLNTTNANLSQKEINLINQYESKMQEIKQELYKYNVIL